MTEQQETKLTAKDLFDSLKKSQEFIDFDTLNRNEANLVTMSQNVLNSGQSKLAKVLHFNLRCIEKERMILDNFPELTTYMNKQEFFNYTNKVQERDVVVSLLREFPREVPEDIALKVSQIKELNIFDDFLIVYTDYTGEVRSAIAEEEREKDPIIFGIFIIESDILIYDRFYFIADWVDEFCDLTMDTLVSEHKNISDQPLIGELNSETFPDLKEIKQALKELGQQDNAKMKLNKELVEKGMTGVLTTKKENIFVRIWKAIWNK